MKQRYTNVKFCNMNKLYVVKEKSSLLESVLNFCKRMVSRKEVVSTRYYKIVKRHKPLPKLKIV